MTKSPHILIYLPDFFEVQGTAVALFNLDLELVSEALPSEAFLSSIVTYDVPTLVDEYRKANISLPPQLIDIGEALRINSGRSRDDGGEKLWDTFKTLSRIGQNSQQVSAFIALVKSRKTRPAHEEFIDTAKAVASDLKLLWILTQERLYSQNELQRFESVEIPIQQICWHRQRAGIRLDIEQTKACLSEVRASKYAAYLELARQTNASPSDMSFRTVRNYLANTDAKYLLNLPSDVNLESEFRIAAKSSKFALQFINYVRAYRDEQVLSKLQGSDYCFPSFQPFGTVTGRILVANPYLQNIRKKYRRVLAASEGHKLAYFDYSQFEPGIFAFLASDVTLIKKYNEGDLYTELSKTLFGTTDQRSFSKQIFLSYLYGMSAENIAKLLSGSGSITEIEGYKSSVARFFSLFPRLEEFRSGMQTDLLRNGQVGTLLGNYRKRTSSGQLNGREKRWSANHPVQGTASLILKEAILALVSKFGQNSILLPIHDAVLMQFPESDYDQLTLEAVELMKNAFIKRCPGLEARVVSGQFSQNQ